MATTGTFAQNTVDGAGKKLGTSLYSENGILVQDVKTIPGENYLATYTVVAAGILCTTTATHLIEIMAGASLNVRVRRIVITESTAAAAVVAWPLQIFRVTTAGTGGVAITPRPLDSNDAAAGATAMTKATSPGSEGVQLWQETMWLGTLAVPVSNYALREAQLDFSKPILIPAGATNGIAIKNTVSTATATVDITIEFTESSF